MARKNRISIVVLLSLFTVFTMPIAAQSSYTKSGLNGAQFDAHTAFNIDDIVQSFGGQLGYSIGGILDIGLDFSMSYDDIEGQDSQETNIGLKYGIMLLKQEDLSPVSLQLSGSYGYSFIDSNYYDNQDLQKEGQGYGLELYLFRDFATGDSSGVRLGPFGGFRSYRYIIQDISLETEEARTYSPVRETNFDFGVNFTIHNTNSQGKTYYFSIKPSGDENLNFAATISTGLVFEIR